MKNTLLLFVTALVCIQLQAQSKQISGIISDENGLPLPGVNVVIKSTTTGAQTNFDGEYSIQANVGDVLVFTYIGYLTAERTVETQNTISFSMQPDKETLDEVVVTGLGLKRSRLYGAKSGVHDASSKIAIRGSSSVSETSSTSSYTPQSGQLTAGEINDLEKWEQWKKTLKDKKAKEIQKAWGFYLENKILVKVKNQMGHPANNVSVTLLDVENNKIMQARTDIKGEATIFKDLHNTCHQDYYTVQIRQNGKVLGKKLTNTHHTVEFVLNEAVQPSGLDVMLTIDATGSMGDELSYLKSELKNIISRVNTSIKQKRVALTFYRDHGDEYVVKDFDFNTDINKVKETLSLQYASGGGDFEEAVELALKVSMQKSWNSQAQAKLLFLLLDAPPHYTQENVETIKAQIKIAQEKGIKIIPIVASGANKDLEFLMRFFSVSTNGTYVFLTDDSGIGNPHLKPSTDTFKVEKLNDLIVRLIEKYTVVNS
ncbi:MAG: VWA domain-containing protein [Algicola sp.]|nr:VWA domain-containing protein [Algicola sp.]